MIERIARRAGGFASTTALRWIGAHVDSAPFTQEPASNGSKAKPIGKTVAAGAVMLIASNEHVRNAAAGGLRTLATTLRPEGRRRSARSAGRSPSSSNGSSNGNGVLSDKSKAELYELAKKKEIPGRSGMSKEELARALSP